MRTEDFKSLRCDSSLDHIRVHGDVPELDVKSIAVPDGLMIDEEGIIMAQ
jgi:hypothetical protein